MSNFFELNLNELDKELSPLEKREWDNIYASYRSGTPLSGKVSGVDRRRIQDTPDESHDQLYFLVVVPYRVKIMIPEEETGFWDSREQAVRVMRGMFGTKIDFVITAIDRENSLCVASRKRAMEIQRRMFAQTNPQIGDRIETQILAAGFTSVIASAGGFDFHLHAKELTYNRVPNYRDVFHPGEICTAVIQEYDPQTRQLSGISIRDAEPDPYIGARERHPLGCRRSCIITGKKNGRVYCSLEENLDCLCYYSSMLYDGEFQIGDRVLVSIVKYLDDRRVILGKILRKW